MGDGLRQLGHPMLATLLTVGMTGIGHADESSSVPPAPAEPVLAEELELMKEEETVSIASRYEQPISQAPSNVYVITDEDIRHSGATDIPTVLRRIPGLEVMQTTGADFNVSVRGDNQLQANKLLVMIDGRSIYVDNSGLLHWKLLPVTLPEIKRIEVLKGPVSAVYGFNAFDGIINIITKSPEEMRGTTVQFGGGELGTISSSAIHAGTRGNFGYRLSFGRDQNQEWRDRDSLAFRAHKFNLRTQYTFSNSSRLSLSGGLIDSNRFDGPMVVSTNFAGMPSHKYADVAYERTGFFVRAWWAGYTNDGRSISHPLLAPFLQSAGRDFNLNTHTRSDTYNLEGQQVLTFGTTHRVTLGASYRHNTLSSNLTSQYGREDRLGLYVQDEWRLADSLTLNAGVRYDLQTFINPTVSPRVALLYHLTEDHTFRATVSVAYRPPTLIENYLDARSIITLPSPLPSPPPLVIGGSPLLSPEQITSYEAGYQGWYLKHRLRVRADLFFNHISDLISFERVGALTNGSEGDIYGGEAGVEFLATPWLSGFANFSYQEVGQGFLGADQRAVPRFKYNFGLRAELDNGINGDIAYHYYGSAFYPINQTFSSFIPFGVVPPAPRRLQIQETEGFGGLLPRRGSGRVGI